VIPKYHTEILGKILNDSTFIVTNFLNTLQVAMSFSVSYLTKKARVKKPRPDNLIEVLNF